MHTQHINCLVMSLAVLLSSCAVYKKQLEDIKDPPKVTTDIIINQKELYGTSGKVSGFVQCINLKCELYDTRSGYGYNKGNFIVFLTEALAKKDLVKIAQCMPDRFCDVAVDGKFIKAPSTSAGIAFIGEKIRYIKYKQGQVSVGAGELFE